METEEPKKLVIPVVYDEKIISDPGRRDHGGEAIPSAHKPKLLVERLLEINNDPKGKFYIILIAVEPLTPDDFKLAHNPLYVDEILNLQQPNGFLTYSTSVVNSLPYTTGAMYGAAQFAFKHLPVCAPVSGFHHAGYAGFQGFGYFCTFNGLMITAMKLTKENPKNRVAIVDCDGHDGNGTRNIIWHLKPERIYHKTFGRIFTNQYHGKAYLEHFDVLRKELEQFEPTHILYQAGADAHIDDPMVESKELKGCLTTEQMYERDVKMFTIARDLGVPLAWNLAGGYQVDKDNNPKKVIDLHINTFNAAVDVYWPLKD